MIKIIFFKKTFFNNTFFAKFFKTVISQILESNPSYCSRNNYLKFIFALSYYLSVHITQIKNAAGL